MKVTTRRILVAISLAVTSCCVWTFKDSSTAHATTGCSSGSVTTTDFYGLLFQGDIETPYWNMITQPDSNQHRITRVSFDSDGNSDAQCTWVAPAGMKQARLLVVGGGGGGGTFRGGGGGGGGVYYARSISFVAGASYDIRVGIGGAAQSTNCVASECNGNAGHSSEITKSGTRIAGAAGGGGGGGDGQGAIAVSCSGFDACGAGGGGASPSFDAPVGTTVSGAPGFAGVNNDSLSFPGNGGKGADGIRENGTVFISGGGGGATTSAAPALGSLQVRTMGASGRPHPATYQNQDYLYGAGGGGGMVDYNGCCSNANGTSLAWGSYYNGAVHSGGGAGGSANQYAQVGKDGYGGGGGGGGPVNYGWQIPMSHPQGNRGGSGNVSIYYLNMPTVSGGQSELTHPYGAASQSIAFTSSGGNNALPNGTASWSTVSYVWSIRDTNGAAIPGVTIGTNGVVTVGATVPLGNISAVVRATDGAGSYGTSVIQISTVQATQSALQFTSSVPVGHHIGGDPYYVTYSGGSGTGAASVAIASSSSTICSLNGSSSGSSVTFQNIGDCVLELNKAGDLNYLNAATVRQTIAVTARSNQSALSISGVPTSPINVGDSVTLRMSGGNGTSSYDLSVASWATTYCSVNGSVVTGLAVGNCVLHLNRSADYNYEAASEVTQVIQVVAGRNLSLSQPTNRIYQYGGTPIDVTVAATVSAGIPFTAAFTVVAGSSICSFGHPSRYDLQFTGVGECTIMVEENDNTYSYTHSAEETFYVIPAGDVTNPTVVSVDAPHHSGNFTTGSSIDIVVHMSERVVVTGTPVLQLETGAIDRDATYVSGNYSDALTFRYLVQPGDVAARLDYLLISSLLLNGGAIKDFSQNNALRTLPSPGTSQSLAGTSQVSVGVISTTTTSSTTSTTTTTTTTTIAPSTFIAEPRAIMVISTSSGFRFTIDDFDAQLAYSFVPSNGGVFSWVARELGIGQITGIPPGQSSTVQMTASLGNAISSAGTAQGTALNAAHVPAFGTVARRAGGFSVPITNFDSSFDYLITDAIGNVDSSTGVLYVSNVPSGQSATITVHTSKSGYSAGEASIVGVALVATTTTTTVTTTVTSDSSSVSNTSPNTSVANQIASPATSARISIKRGKSLKLSVIARAVGVVVPRRAVLTGTVSAASRLKCAVVGVSLKAKKRGICTLTLVVRPTRGALKRKTLKIFIE